MQTKQALKKIIKDHRLGDLECRIYFDEFIMRTPQSGAFVTCEDADELDSKGFVRWVSWRNILEYDETNNINLTSLLKIDSIISVKTLI